MSDEKDLVRLDVARTPFEAQVLLTVLENAGIPAHVSGLLCPDEFAITQLTMGARTVEIAVPRDRQQDAMAAIAAAREQGRTSGAELAQARHRIGDRNDNRKSPLVAGLLGLIFGPLGLLYVMSFKSVFGLWMVEIALITSAIITGVLDDALQLPRNELAFLLLHGLAGGLLAHRRNRRTQEGD